VVGKRPIETFTGAAPVTEEMPALIEFEHRRSGCATLGDGRTGGGVISPGSSDPSR
jgi:hypothetical protein